MKMILRSSEHMKIVDKQIELNNCSTIKSILMLLIVLYHSAVIYAGGGTWGPFQSINEAPFIGICTKWLNSFHIYGFTLISGYIFYYIKYEKDGYQDYLPFLKNKALRLLVPYAFVTMAWVMPIDIYFYGVNELKVSSYLLGMAQNQLWFLLMLFWVFAIFWLMSNLANRHPLVGGIIVCVLYCVGLVTPGYYWMNRGLQYLLFFYIGFIIRKCDLGNSFLYKIPSLLYVIANVGLFALCELLGNYEGVIFKGLNLGSSVLCHIVGAVGVFVVLQRFVNRFLQGNKVVDFFGNHSMVIYLVHQQLIYFSIGWFNGVVSPIILVLINFTFSLGVSTVFSVLMHKTKVTKFLVGSK